MRAITGAALIGAVGAALNGGRWLRGLEKPRVRPDHRHFRLGSILTLLLSTGCFPSRLTTVRAGYEAPVIAVDSLPFDRSGETLCAYNNEPFVKIPLSVLQSVFAEFALLHEQTHAYSAVTYPGGCWPFFYRYRDDRLFRIREELKAYCTEGRLAIRRNVKPEYVWQRIVDALAKDTTLTAKDNCLYSGEP